MIRFFANKSCTRREIKLGKAIMEERKITEQSGRHYEQFEVGDTYSHRPGRTISETDNTWFTLLTMNTHPLHFDKEYAKKSEFGQILVNSAFTVSLIVGMRPRCKSKRDSKSRMERNSSTLSCFCWRHSLRRKHCFRKKRI